MFTPTIKDNAIMFNDHKVVLELELHVDMPDYIHEMFGLLSADGTAEDHVNELEDMNNDGSWTVVIL